jgi:nucleoid-associated protein YgaU
VKFYGSVEKYDLIYQANRKVLSSPNAIQVGQRLAIPEVAG